MIFRIIWFNWVPAPNSPKYPRLNCGQEELQDKERLERRRAEILRRHERLDKEGARAPDDGRIHLACAENLPVHVSHLLLEEQRPAVPGPVFGDAKPGRTSEHRTVVVFLLHVHAIGAMLLKTYLPGIHILKATNGSNPPHDLSISPPSSRWGENCHAWVVRFGSLVEAREGDVPLTVDVQVAAPCCEVHVEGSVLGRSVNRAVVVIDIGLAHVMLIPQLGMRIPLVAPATPR